MKWLHEWRPILAYRTFHKLLQELTFYKNLQNLHGINDCIRRCANVLQSEEKMHSLGNWEKCTKLSKWYSFVYMGVLQSAELQTGHLFCG